MMTNFVGQQSVLVQAEDMLSCWQRSFELGLGPLNWGKLAHKKKRKN